MKREMFKLALEFALKASKEKIALAEHSKIKEQIFVLRYLGELIELVNKMKEDEIVMYLNRYANAPRRNEYQGPSLWPEMKIE